MITLDHVLSGIIIAIVSLGLGKIWGDVGKVSFKQCQAFRDGCTGTNDTCLEAIKENQREMKEDIREIKSHLLEIYGDKLNNR